MSELLTKPTFGDFLIQEAKKGVMFGLHIPSTTFTACLQRNLSCKNARWKQKGCHVELAHLVNHPHRLLAEKFLCKSVRRSDEGFPIQKQKGRHVQLPHVVNHLRLIVEQ